MQPLKAQQGQFTTGEGLESQQAAANYRKIPLPASDRGGQQQPEALRGVTDALEIPLEQLQETTRQLEERWQRSARFVRDQEEELNWQRHLVAKLAAKLQAAKGQEEPLRLKTELEGEREKQQLLEATLVGQRQNLKQQQVACEQYQQLLEQRQGSFAVASKSEDKVRQFPAASQLEVAREVPPKPEKKLGRWVLALGAGGLLAVAATAFSALKLFPQPATVPTPVGVVPPSSESVAALGYLTPKGEAISLSAPSSVNGVRVAQLLVKQGDLVKTGQVVAVLDTRDRLQAALEQAQSQVVIARSHLERVRAGAKTGDILAQDTKSQRTQAELAGQIAAQRAEIASQIAQLQGEKQAQQATLERLQAEWRNAQSDCQRYQKLHEDGAVSVQQQEQFCLQQETAAKSLAEANANLQRIVGAGQQRIDAAKANLNRTAATLQKQFGEERASLRSVAEVRPTDVRVAQAELQAAEVAVKKAQAELATAYVLSPREGRILKIYAWPGEVPSDKGIVTLGETGQMYVRAEVYETDISRVRLGQRATIESEGIAGKLPGIVEEIGWQVGKQSVIGTDPAADVDARVVEVKIRLQPAASQQIAGLTNLQVNVVIHTK